jgi:hypothetical protein
MFGEKFGSKWFDSKLIIIISITSLYDVWRSLDDKIRIRHNFWELGRRIDLQLRANEPEENDTHYFFHYNKITCNKPGVEIFGKKLTQYRICFNKQTKIMNPYTRNNNNVDKELE